MKKNLDVVIRNINSILCSDNAGESIDYNKLWVDILEALEEYNLPADVFNTLPADITTNNTRILSEIIMSIDRNDLKKVIILSETALKIARQVAIHESYKMWLEEISNEALLIRVMKLYNKLVEIDELTYVVNLLQTL